MNKLEYLHQAKTYLRKVRDYRRNLLKHETGKPANVNMVRTLAELDYRIPLFISFEEIFRYLVSTTNQANLRELIPSNKPAWNKELDEFIITGYQLHFGRKPEFV